MAWLFIAGLASVIGFLGVRIIVLNEAMVRAIAAQDPDFRPNQFNPNRVWLLSECRRRFPQGKLAAKMRHVEWGLGGVGLAFVVLFFVVRGIAR